MPARDGPRAPHRRDQRGQPPLRGRRRRATRHPAARLSGVLVLVAAPDHGPRAPFPRRRARSPRLRSERQAPERRGVRAPRAGRRRARAGRGVRRAPGGDRRPRLGRRRRLELRHGAPGGHAAPRGDELPAPGDLRAASQDRPPPARTQLVHVLLPDPVAPGGAPRPRPRAPNRRRHPPHGGAPGLAQRGGPPAPPRGGLPDRKSTRLNSSHGSISYAVFCLKKKKVNGGTAPPPRHYELGEVSKTRADNASLVVVATT